MVSKEILVIKRNLFLENLEKDLQNELHEVLAQEEILWYQKSWAKWIVDGDRNTRYYHTKTVIRRRHNKVLPLRNEEGNWETYQFALKNIAMSHFKHLFSEDVPNKFPISSLFFFFLILIRMSFLVFLLNDLLRKLKKLCLILVPIKPRVRTDT